MEDGVQKGGIIDSDTIAVDLVRGTESAPESNVGIFDDAARDLPGNYGGPFEGLDGRSYFQSYGTHLKD